MDKSELARQGIVRARQNPEFEAKRLAGLRAFHERARAAKAAQQNGHVADINEAIGMLTPEQIVSAIQQRIDELSAENQRLHEMYDEARALKEGLQKEVYDLRKENKEMAQQLREAKEQQRSGLRLFRSS